eukprot:g5128.t1
MGLCESCLEQGKARGPPPQLMLDPEVDGENAEVNAALLVGYNECGRVQPHAPGEAVTGPAGFAASTSHGRRGAQTLGRELIASKAALEASQSHLRFRAKKHSTRGARHATLKRTAEEMLSSDDLASCVRLRSGCSYHEWVEVHLIDFYNELGLFVSMVEDAGGWRAPGMTDVGAGFPPAFEYRWAARRGERPSRCSAAEYVSQVMNWVCGEVDRLPGAAEKPGRRVLGSGAAAARSPTSSDQILLTGDPRRPSSSAAWEPLVLNIFKRMFRVYAIIFCTQHDVIERLGAVPHLSTCFKRFMFFVFEFELVETRELKALNVVVDGLRRQYSDGIMQRSSSPGPSTVLSDMADWEAEGKDDGDIFF